MRVNTKISLALLAVLAVNLSKLPFSLATVSSTVPLENSGKYTECSINLDGTPLSLQAVEGPGSGSGDEKYFRAQSGDDLEIKLIARKNSEVSVKGVAYKLDFATDASLNESEFFGNWLNQKIELRAIDGAVHELILFCKK